MFVNGERKVIVVDDYFPYNESSKNWAMSKSSSESEIWVMLLEKAWAKIFGSYMRIEGGTTGEALPVLCGAPTVTTKHKEIEDRDGFWRKLYYSDHLNYPIATEVYSPAS